MIWFSSDWHLDHLRILELCDRPFDTVDEMNDAIIDAVNAEVARDHVLYLLGDIAMGQMIHSLPLLERIVCENVFVTPGNHDRISSLYPQKPAKLVEWRASRKYEAVGLHPTAEQWSWTTSATIGLKMTVCHLPYGGNIYPTDNTGEPRFEEASPVDDGGWLLHGHVHQLWRQRGRQINVGVDAWAGKPVPATTVAAMVHAGPAMLDPLPWTR